MRTIREPAVAGTFYDGAPEGLRRSLDALFLGRLGPGRLPPRRAEGSAQTFEGRETDTADLGLRNIVALVSPHAGYQFSGYAAAAAYLDLAEDGIPDSVVIIGPNHHGYGAAVAMMREGAWQTPLGEVEIDSELADRVLTGSRYLAVDSTAHRLEHSLEVQVPFLQHIGGSRTKIVPITVSALSPTDAVELASDLGRAIASAVAGRNAVVIASTDFTHYEPQASAEEKDRLAIQAIEELDAEKLLANVERYHITMCGAVPTAVAITAAKALGAVSASLLSYYTSGDVLGDPSQVVGYAALKLCRRKA